MSKQSAVKGRRAYLPGDIHSAEHSKELSYHYVKQDRFQTSEVKGVISFNRLREHERRVAIGLFIHGNRFQAATAQIHSNACFQG